jgi:drug/metabolite transporter (DMT)-like permease
MRFMHKLSPAIATRQGMSGRSWAILLALSVLWGGSFFFIEIAIRDVRPFTLVLVRVTLAAAALWLFVLARKQVVPRTRETAAAFVVLALLNNVLPFSLFAWGQTQIESGLASILNATTPIWGVIVAHLFTGDERMTPGKIAGVLLGFAGVAVMIGGDLLKDLGGELLAQLACLAATLSYAFAGVYARRFKAMGVPPTMVATGQLSASALLVLPLVLLFEQPWKAAAPGPATWAALLALALFCTSLAYILYFQLVASAGATNTLLVTFLIPITAILLGSLVLGEVLEGRHFAGMALIGLGLAAIDGRLLRRRPMTSPLPG